MRVYYAHCIAIYNTLQETRDIQLLEEMFGDRTHAGGDADIINPNTREIEAQCTIIRREGNVMGTRSASARIMSEIFKPLVQSCDIVAFRSLPDGRIPAGVAKEILWAQGANIPTLELPSNILGREMSVRETRAYLAEVGQR